MKLLKFFIILLIIVCLVFWMKNYNKPNGYIPSNSPIFKTERDYVIYHIKHFMSGGVKTKRFNSSKIKLVEMTVYYKSSLALISMIKKNGKNHILIEWDPNICSNEKRFEKFSYLLYNLILAVSREPSSKESKQYIYRWIKGIVQGDKKTPLEMTFNEKEICKKNSYLLYNLIWVICREPLSKESKEYIYKWIKEIAKGNQKTPLKIIFTGMYITYNHQTSSFAFSWQGEGNKKTNK